MRALLIASIAVLTACSQHEPRPNLGLYKNQLVAWHNEGRYEQSFARAVRPAEQWLQRVIETRKPGDRPAVVLDIDETCLSNWGYLTEVNFGVEFRTFAKWTNRHDNPALKPVLELYRRARAAGLPVFLITGRKESLRVATVRQLKAAGFQGWEGLYMEPEGYDQASVIPYKSGVRRQLEARGYRVVLNMGDQWSDLVGGAAERAFKLPNPFYFIR